jgi:hypothetical protein
MGSQPAAETELVSNAPNADSVGRNNAEKQVVDFGAFRRASETMMHPWTGNDNKAPRERHILPAFVILDSPALWLVQLLWLLVTSIIHQ